MRAAKRVVVPGGRIVTPYHAGKPFRVDAPRVVTAIVEFNRDHLAHKGELILFKLLQCEPRKLFGAKLRTHLAATLKICATRFVKRGMTIRDLICWIVAWSPASYANELGVFDFALVALPNERKTSTNGGTLAPALSMKALVS